MQGPPTPNPFCSWGLSSSAASGDLAHRVRVAVGTMALLWVKEREGHRAAQAHVTAPVRTEYLGAVVEGKAIYPKMNTVSLFRNHCIPWEVLGNGGVLWVTTLTGEVCYWSYWTGVPRMPNIL